MITATVDFPAPSASLSRDDKVVRTTVVAAMVMLIAAPTILMLASLPPPLLLSAIAVILGIVATAGCIVFTADDHQRAISRGLILAGVILLAFPIPIASGASAPTSGLIDIALRNEALLTLAVFSVSVGASCLALGLVMARREAPSQEAVDAVQ